MATIPELSPRDDDANETEPRCVECGEYESECICAELDAAGVAADEARARGRARG